MGVTRSRLSARSAPDEVARPSTTPGRPEDLGGSVVLLEHAADVEDRDAVAHLHRLLDVVGDEHDRLLHLRLQPEELVLQARAGDRVDGAERLVHQQDGRVGGERTRHADPLALPAGELRGIPRRGSRRVEPHEVEQLVDAGADAALRPAEQARDGRDVGGDVWCGNSPTCWIT